MSTLEKQVAELYEDIHPFIDVEQTINDYLETLGVGPEFFKGKNILDCGFGGTGWAVELFARSGARTVAGVDLNPIWSKRVAQRLGNYEDVLDLRAGTVLDLFFSDNTFDYVHSHGVMHHTTDWKKGVREMTRVVKPGGTIYLMLYGKFAPVGRLIHFSYRFAGKIIPYAWTAFFVKKTGIYRDHELSLLDAMYVPIEEHLSAREIREHLEACGMINIRFFTSAKWKKKRFYSSHMMFGPNIQNVVWADKPL